MSMSNQRHHTYDAATLLKDAGLVAASAAAQVSSANKILDVGNSVLSGSLVADISAIEVASNDEVYDIRIEGSNSSTFASNIQVLGSIRVGSAGGIGTNYALSTTGRYEVRFVNVQNGTTYQYLRAYTVVGGSIATGINYTAFIAKD